MKEVDVKQLKEHFFNCCICLKSLTVSRISYSVSSNPEFN